MDRLSPLDASFLHVERDIQPMHIGGVQIFEGPAPSYEDVCAVIEAKLPQVPRYRQVVRHAPLDLGSPVWVDDPHFNIAYHIRHTALPVPGTERQLKRLVGRLMSVRLDRDRPLWEIWLIEGLEQDRWAMMGKTHHAMVDGMSGSDILSKIFDREPRSEVPVPAPWHPRPVPSEAQIIKAALGDTLNIPLASVRAIAAAARAPRDFAEWATVTGRGAWALGSKVAAPSGTILNGPIGPHRRWDWSRTSLADVKAVRKTLGGTVNDVILAAITGGFRTFLLARDEDLTGRTIRSMVPVSVRPAGAATVHNNQVSAMFVDLPVGLADPAERLRAISDQMRSIKESGMALGADAMVSAADFVPPTLLAMGGRLAARLPQRQVSTVTTNVPGAQIPLYLLGRRLLEAFPIVPLGADLRIAIAIFSYNGQLNCGISGDYDTVRDLHVLAQGIEAATAELVATAEAAAATAQGRMPDPAQKAPSKAPAAKGTTGPAASAPAAKRSATAATTAADTDARPAAKSRTSTGTRTATKSPAKSGTTTRAATKAAAKSAGSAATGSRTTAARSTARKTPSAGTSTRRTTTRTTAKVPAAPDAAAEPGPSTDPGATSS